MPYADLERIWQRVAAFYPLYDADGGNSTRIIFENGRDIFDTRKTKTFLGALAKVFAADLTALRKKYGKLLGRKNYVPLPFHADFVIVPVRVRRALSKDQGATGYLVLDRVKSCGPAAEKDFSCKVEFSGGGYLYCMEKAATVRKKLLEAKTVREEYCRFHAGQGAIGVPGLAREVLKREKGCVVYHLHCSVDQFLKGS